MFTIIISLLKATTGGQIKPLCQHEIKIIKERQNSQTPLASVCVLHQHFQYFFSIEIDQRLLIL